MEAPVQFSGNEPRVRTRGDLERTRGGAPLKQVCQPAAPWKETPYLPQGLRSIGRLRRGFIIAWENQNMFLIR